METRDAQDHTFRGGSVTDIVMQVDPDDLSVRIPVFIEVDPGRIATAEGKLKKKETPRQLALLIEKGLRGQLEMQSIVTGQLMIQFDFHPDKEALYAGVDMGVPELPTIPTPFQEVAKTLQSLNLQEMGDKITTALEGIGTALGSEEMAEGLKSVPVILKETEGLIQDLRRDIAPVLAGADGALTDTRKLLRNLDAKTDSVGAGLEGAVGDTRTLVQSVNARVDPLADSGMAVMNEGTALLKHADQAVQDLLAAVDGTMKIVDTALQQADSAMQKIDGELAAGPQVRYELTVALQEVSAAARSIRVVSDMLQQRPDVLLRGKSSGGH